MNNGIKRIFFLRLIKITSILYTITILIYFLFFYRKFQPIYGEHNKFMKTMYIDEQIIFFMLSLTVCIVTSVFISIIYQEIVFCIKPIMDVNAKLKSKESVVQRCKNDMGFASNIYNYNLIFELDNGTELSFVVNPKHYMMIFEGNRGTLRYKQQGLLNRFIGFDITAIE